MSLLPIPRGGPEGETPEDLEPSPQVLEELVEKLPLAHMDDASKQLLVLLDPAAIQRLPQKRRLEMLKAIEPACTGLVERLEKAARDAGLPLPDKVRKRAEYHLAICRALALSYQGIRSELQPNPRKLLNLAGANQWSRACVQILQWTERAINLRLRLHLPLPDETWTDLHRLFQEVSAAGLTDKPVKVESAAEPITIGALYKRILLRATLPLAALSQDQMEQVEQRLTGWSELLTLAPCSRQLDRAHSPVFLDPQIDDGPRTYGQRCSQCSGGDCLLLISEPLRKYLAAQPADTGISAATLALLQDPFTLRPDRAKPRYQVDETARTLFGFGAVCHVLQQAKARRQGDGEGGNAFSEEITYAGIESPAHTTFSNPLSGHGPQYEFINVILCDVSESGFRLEVLTKPGLQLKVGDLCGIQRRESRSLSAARIRWIRAEHGQSLTIGASFVAHRLRPATLISRPKKGEIARNPCFLGKHPESGQTVIGLMPIAGILERKIAVDRSGHKTRIALKTPPVDGSASFELYEFRKKKRSKRRAPDELKLPDDLQQQPDDGSTLSELNVETIDDISGLSAFVGGEQD